MLTTANSVISDELVPFLCILCQGNTHGPPTVMQIEYIGKAGPNRTDISLGNHVVVLVSAIIRYWSLLSF